MDLKVQKGLEICRKTAKILKDAFPNEIMKLEYDTIILFEKKDRRCSKRKKSMARTYACYMNGTPHRVLVRDKTLIERNVAISGHGLVPFRHKLHGNFALAELIAHELAHHGTKLHAKGWKIKYMRFFQYIVNQFISGKFYE